MNAARASLPPSEQSYPRFFTPLGLALRFVCGYVLILSLTAFAFDAMWIDVTMPRMLLITLAVSVPIALMTLSRRAFIICGAAILVALIITAHIIGRPFALLVQSFTYVKYCVTSIFTYNVFNSFDGVGPDLLWNARILIDTAVFCVSAALSAVIVPFTVRRVRLLPIAAAALSVMAPAFTFNLCRSSAPFALSMAALTGFAVLSRYEYTFFRREGLSLRERGTGGFTAFAVTLIAALIIALPAVYVQKPWWTMEYIYDRVTEIRARLSSGMNGGDDGIAGAGLSEGGGVIESLGMRSAVAMPRSFSGQLILRVKSLSPRPIYLRSWIGFEYSDNLWHGVTDMAGDLDYFKRFGDGFMPEALTVDCFRSLAGIDNPSVLFKEAKSCVDYGFITSPVDVEVITPVGYLMFVPTVFDSEIGMLSANGSANEPYEEATGVYLDGVILTNRFSFSKSYRAFAYLPVHDKFAESCNAMAELYRRLRPDTAAKIADYSDFAASYYLKTDDSEVLRDYISEKLGGLVSVGEDGQPSLRDKSPSGIDSAVMAVIKSLGEDCRYTQNPSPYETGCAMKDFLFESREGYCVQFATASALLLREMGVPARYAEGYIAANPIKKGNSYAYDVTDEAAHAWVEVYIEPFGWMQYETTTAYYDDAYRPVAAEHENDEILPDDALSDLPSENVNNADIGDFDGDFTTDAVRASINLTAVIVVAALIFAAFIVLNAVKTALRRKNAYKSAFAAESDEERRDALRALHAEARLLLKRRGFIEDKYEHISQFSARLDRASSDGGFTDLPCSHSAAFELFRAAEFGSVPDKADVITAAEYVSALNRKAGRRTIQGNGR